MTIITFEHGFSFHFREATLRVQVRGDVSFFPDPFSLRTSPRRPWCWDLYNVSSVEESSLICGPYSYRTEILRSKCQEWVLGSYFCPHTVRFSLNHPKNRQDAAAIGQMRRFQMEMMGFATVGLAKPQPTPYQAYFDPQNTQIYIKHKNIGKKIKDPNEYASFLGIFLLLYYGKSGKSGPWILRSCQILYRTCIHRVYTTGSQATNNLGNHVRNAPFPREKLGASAREGGVKRGRIQTEADRRK